MIVNQNGIDEKEFLGEFKKRFENFCNRVPLFLKPYFTENKVILYNYKSLKEMEKEKLFEYEFNYGKDVKENIYEIRKQLSQNYYPIMSQIKEEETHYEPEVLNKMISEGNASLDDVTPSGGLLKTQKIDWRIEKVVIGDDTILLRNLKDNRVYMAHLRMPVTTFLKTILSEVTDPFERWTLFERKHHNLQLFYEVDKQNKKLSKYHQKKDISDANN